MCIIPDVNLLLDAIRKTVTICGSRLLIENGRVATVSTQYRAFKRKSRNISKLKRSNARDEVKREARNQQIQAAHRDYIEDASIIWSVRARRRQAGKRGENQLESDGRADRARSVRETRRAANRSNPRRVLNGETIAHDEKVFSIFEDYTEWVSKGKPACRWSWV